MKLTEKQMKAIMWDRDAGFEYEKIVQTDWQDEGKFQSCDVIFETDKKFYSYSMSRWGDHWSGYDYEFDSEVIEVKKVEVTTHAWVPVEDRVNPFVDVEIPLPYIHEEESVTE